MAIIYNPIGGGTTPTQAYKDLRFNLVSAAEGFHSGLYYDSNGILTNGFGFNLRIGDLREEVIKSMGFDVSAPLGSAEKDFLDRIDTLLSNGSSGAPGDATTLQVSVDAVMAEREVYYSNPPAGGFPVGTDVPDNLQSSFVFSQKANARNVFDFVADTRFGPSNPSYEERIGNHENKWGQILPFAFVN